MDISSIIRKSIISKILNVSRKRFRLSLFSDNRPTGPRKIAILMFASRIRQRNVVRSVSEGNITLLVYAWVAGPQEVGSASSEVKHGNQIPDVL